MSKAFTYEVNPNFSDIHSTSPAWVITFIRWQDRYLSDGVDPKGTREPLVITDGCFQVAADSSKESHTPSTNMMFYPGDINYITAVAPGDFFVLNILNNEEDANRVADKAKKKQPINEFNDGFKGLYRVHSVRRTLAVDPQTGKKILAYNISGFAFTEFNNTVYFNPLLIFEQQKSPIIFLERLSKKWAEYFNKKDGGTLRTQNIIRMLISSFIGYGFGKNNTSDLPDTQNTVYAVPTDVGALLGEPKAKYMSQINRYHFGIQKFSEFRDQSNITPDKGFMFEVSEKGSDNNLILAKESCNGWTLLKPEYWNSVSAWSILKQYENYPINELFNSFRVSRNGRVMPVVTYRQIPFSSKNFKEGQATYYLTVPRWKISTNLLMDYDVGRDESLRFNLVQIFGTASNVTEQANNFHMYEQLARQNFVSDSNDIQRSGLRPYIITNTFDNYFANKNFVYTPLWTRLMADVLIGGHLRLNGTIKSVGIQDPIAPGDNLELEGIVYHIESVRHMCGNSEGGNRYFYTTLTLSHGVLADQTDGVYPQMKNTKHSGELEDQEIRDDGILPGASVESTQQTGEDDPPFKNRGGDT